MASEADQFAGIAREVALALLGSPNKALSSARELRFGSRGSVSVDLKTGRVYDHSNGEGGGILWLVERERGLKGRDAANWIREQGFDLPAPAQDKPAARPPRAQTSRADDGPPPWEPEESRPAERTNKAPKGDIVRTWDYVDASGDLVFQVCRLEDGSVDPKTGKKNKTFRQRRPDGSGGWSWSVKGITQVPYRLPEVVESIASGLTVFVVEGEKAADALWNVGIPATTNAMGAGKWPDDLTPHFDGADVVILPDNDEPGAKHRDRVGTALSAVAASVRILDLPNLPEKGDVVEWLEAGGTPDALYDLVETAGRPFGGVEPEAPAEFVSKFGAVAWRDLDAPGPQHEWLVKGLMTRGELSMLAGPSQSGKSFLAIDLAMSVARGVPWFGMKAIRGGVVYQAGESARGVRRKRIPAYRQWHGVRPDDDVPFVLLTKPVDLYASEDQTTAMIAEIRHWASTFTVPLELVVIDTFSAATPGANENASEDVSKVLARCQRISEATNAAVLLVHHLNAAADKPRGHTSILANLDSVLICRKDDTRRDGKNRIVREVKVAKAKDGEDSIVRHFVLPSVEIGRDDDGDPITSCAVTEPKLDDQDEAAPKKGLKLRPAEVSFMSALIAATNKAGIRPPLEMKLPDSVARVVDYSVVKEEFARINPYDGDENDIAEKTKWRERLKKNLQRARESLQRFQVIGCDNPLIWSTGKPVIGLPKVVEQDEPLPPAALSDDPFAF